MDTPEPDDPPFFNGTNLARRTLSHRQSSLFDRRVPKGISAREDPIPKFFFDHWDGQAIDRDDEGLELPDLDTAYLEAFRAATEMWIEALREVRNPGRERFEIRDAEGQLLLVLPFSEIIERGNGARRPPPSFGALMEAMERTRSLQAALGAQIDIAWSRIREARQALARLDAAGRG